MTDTTTDDKAILALLDSIKKNDLTEAERLITDGADVNGSLPSTGPLVGKSLLYVAALLDNYEAAELLLKHGAVITLGFPDDKRSHSKNDQDETNPRGETTLCAANADLCPIDPTCGNSNGQMLKLMDKYTEDLKNISLLTQNELDTTEPHFNLLQYYCTWNNSQILAMDTTEAKTVAQTCDSDCRKWQNGKFFQTSPHRRKEFIRTLVEDLGIGVNYAPYPGLTALYIACKYHNSAEVVGELLRLGARVNDTADDKRPIDMLLEYEISEVDPLEENNLLGVFKLLIEYGSSIQHRCVSNKKTSTSENELQGQKARTQMTLLERISRLDVSFQTRMNLMNCLISSGYNLSMDLFLLEDSHPFTRKIKADSELYQFLMKNMREATSLLSQCRRAIVQTLSDPCWDQISSLQENGVPTLIVDYLHFNDM